MIVRDIVDLYEDNWRENSIFIYQRLLNNDEAFLSDYVGVCDAVDNEFVYSFRFRDNRLELIV